MAALDGTSLNQFIVAAIAERVGAETLYYKLSQQLQPAIVARAFAGAASFHLNPRVQSKADTSSRPPFSTGAN